MTDYISRKGIMKEFSDFVRASNNSDFEPTPNWNDAVSLVGSYPSADVVEVVRCKDCLYGHRCFDVRNGETDSWVECRNPDGLNRDVSVDGFCYMAERREDE